MTDESNRRSGLVAAAADAQAAWQRLYERLLQVEFDGYAGADPDVFLRAMETGVERAPRYAPYGRASGRDIPAAVRRSESRSSTVSSHGGHDEL
jgi:hypothetical protein